MTFQFNFTAIYDLLQGFAKEINNITNTAIIQPTQQGIKQASDWMQNQTSGIQNIETTNLELNAMQL